MKTITLYDNDSHGYARRRVIAGEIKAWLDEHGYHPEDDIDLELLIMDKWNIEDENEALLLLAEAWGMVKIVLRQN